MVSDTPATTIVEECKRADTGVGPSIALGSQPEKTNIDDFVKTATIKSTQIPFNIDKNKQMSPTRLMQSAKEEDDTACDRPEKVPIK